MNKKVAVFFYLLIIVVFGAAIYNIIERGHAIEKISINSVKTVSSSANNFQLFSTHGL